MFSRYALNQFVYPVFWGFSKQIFIYSTIYFPKNAPFVSFQMLALHSALSSLAS